MILSFTKVKVKEKEICASLQEEADRDKIVAMVRTMANKGYALDSVNDDCVIGTCESCGMPIIEGEEYRSDHEGVLVCKRCF